MAGWLSWRDSVDLSSLDCSAFLLLLITMISLLEEFYPALVPAAVGLELDDPTVPDVPLESFNLRAFF